MENNPHEILDVPVYELSNMAFRDGDLVLIALKDETQPEIVRLLWGAGQEDVICLTRELRHAIL